MDFWDFVALFFWSFVFLAYLMVLVNVLFDVARDPTMSGWYKALWIAFLVFVPVVTALVYLIARGRGMAERRLEATERTRRDTIEYVTTSPGATPVEEIDNARRLRDEGAISPAEYETLKARALGRAAAPRPMTVPR